MALSSTRITVSKKNVTGDQQVNGQLRGDNCQPLVDNYCWQKLQRENSRLRSELRAENCRPLVWSELIYANFLGSEYPVKVQTYSWQLLALSSIRSTVIKKQENVTEGYPVKVQLRADNCHPLVDKNFCCQKLYREYSLFWKNLIRADNCQPLVWPVLLQGKFFSRE